MTDISAYLDRYRGQWFTIVGKGPTFFQWENLKEIRGPVAFINDAVQLAPHAANAAERFFFAHDVHQAIWLEDESADGVTPVLASRRAKSHTGEPLLSKADLPDSIPSHINEQIVDYEWEGWWEDAQLGGMSRQDLAKHRRLYLNSGTIHSAIHFAWLCGAAGIRFIGCEGFGRDYDARIERAAGPCTPGVFQRIRRVQDEECRLLGLPTEYVAGGHIKAVIPRLAHFIWFGPMPYWARENIALFEKHNPDWGVRLWRHLPVELPSDLAKAAVGAEQLCMRSDILRYWLLQAMGGVYLDCDMLTLRSFEPLRRFDAWVWRDHSKRVTCSAMGSVPGGTAFETVLAGVREEAARKGAKHRTAYGPKLLTSLFGPDGERPTGDMAILPQHYFGLLIDQKEAHPFWSADEAGRAATIAAHQNRVTDTVAPFSMHLNGIEGSSFCKPFGRGEALGGRLRAMAADRDRIVGAEVGVLAGRLSAYLLRMVPEMELYMVDRWAATDPDSDYARSGDTAATMDAGVMMKQMVKATDATSLFAKRRTIMRGDSVEMAAELPDGHLDFVFIDANHTYEGVKADLAAWYPKIRPGGLISGHDIDNPLGGVTFENPLWGVRRAVEEFMAEVCPGADLELGEEYTWYFKKPAVPQPGKAVLPPEGATVITVRFPTEEYLTATPSRHLYLLRGLREAGYTVQIDAAMNEHCMSTPAAQVLAADFSYRGETTRVWCDWTDFETTQFQLLGPEDLYFRINLAPEDMTDRILPIGQVCSPRNDHEFLEALPTLRARKDRRDYEYDIIAIMRAGIPKFRQQAAQIIHDHPQWRSLSGLQPIREIYQIPPHLRRDRLLPFMEHFQAQSRSKIALALPGVMSTVHLDWSWRHTEILAMGVCMLTVQSTMQWVGDPKGCWVEMKRDLSDMAEKVSYYLEHDDEREAIARRGRDYYDQWVSPLATARYVADNVRRLWEQRHVH